MKKANKKVEKFVVFSEDTQTFKKGEVVRLTRLPKLKEQKNVVLLVVQPDPVIEYEDELYVFDDATKKEVIIPTDRVILDLDTEEWQETLRKTYRLKITKKLESFVDLNA